MAEIPERSEPTPYGDGETVESYLTGRSVLVTGGTGLLGKALVEKILRDAPGVAHVFLLIRPGRRRDGSRCMPDERLREEIVASDVFDRLRRERADFEQLVAEKLTAVPADVSVDRLGLLPVWSERLRECVDVIVNSAAVVTFDERLDAAVEHNTLGPKRLLDFAHACKLDPVFVHVSTAYVNGRRRGEAPEEILRPGHDIAGEAFDLDREIELGLERGDRHLGMQRARLHGWHDTYTYTKAMGEQLLVREHGDTPLAIVRPSIIESALAEPHPGWISGLRMADPLIAALGKGRLKHFPGHPDCVMDIVPVDFVVKATLAAIPAIARRRGVEVIQVTTGAHNPLHLSDLVDHVVHHFRRDPMHDRRGTPIAVQPLRLSSHNHFRRKHRFGYQIPLTGLEWLGRRLPGLRPLRERAGQMRRRVDRILHYGDIYAPYVTYSLRFHCTNSEKLSGGLAPLDRDRFGFDVRDIDWRSYIADVHVPGLRRHVLQERRPPAPRPDAGGEGSVR